MEITKDSDRGRWETLMAVWEQEKRPGYIVIGNRTYTVLVMNGGDTVKFIEGKSNEHFYESTSF